MKESNDKQSNLIVHPVILSGGVGSRLWPLSRQLYPKQLLPLASENTLLQDTAVRVAESDLFAAPLVICNSEHRFMVAEQLREVDASPRAIVLEPEGRHTAPAAAVAAILLERDFGDALLMVLPSDHLIEEPAGFIEAVRTAPLSLSVRLRYAVAESTAADRRPHAIWRSASRLRWPSRPLWDCGCGRRHDALGHPRLDLRGEPADGIVG